VAIRAIGKEKRYTIEVEGVTLIFSKVLSNERGKIEDDVGKRGIFNDRVVKDKLLKKHTHGYVQKFKDNGTVDPESCLLDENDKIIDPDDFRPSIVSTWTDDIIAPLYTAMHENDSGEDIREAGGDRLGNSPSGSTVHTPLVE